jgi:hypothetical protein
MVMYSFVTPFRETKFCGVPSCVFDKLGCAAGEKRLREHWSSHMLTLWGGEMYGFQIWVRGSPRVWVFVYVFGIPTM